jgi:hypothetical protein
MEYAEIIKQYLPLLQDLQANVAQHKGFTMTITCDGWDISVYLFSPNQRPEDGMHEHFHTGYSEDDLKQKFINLEAYFAQQFITTPTCVNSPISLN